MGNETDDFVKAGAIIAGIGLVLGLIKLLGEKRYLCPMCNRDIRQGVNQCPHCKTHLRWNQ